MSKSLTDQDCELLRLAAKAIGYDFQLCMITGAPCIVDVKGGGVYWNPLDKDGDTLRLAVKLQLDVSFGQRYYFDEGPMTFCGEYWDCNESKYFKSFVKHKSDPYAATRRAIVRAAAEIGRNMQ